jgi:DNA-binding NtrC family response regulator
MVVLNGHKGRIEFDDLPPEQEDASLISGELEDELKDEPKHEFNPAGNLPTVETLVKQYILHVLDHVDRHQGKASQILGLSRRTLYRKLKVYTQP